MEHIERIHARPHRRKDPLHCDLCSRQLSLNGRFRLNQQIQNDFWEAWMGDCLATLQLRSKWFKNGPQISTGDLVLLAKDNFPPLSWETCRDADAYTRNDDIARVVKRKTAAGESLKPVVKLKKLPIDH